MANLDGFDATTVDPMVAYDPIPAGDYLAVITASNMKRTKSGNGQYLELTFQLLDGEYKGRTLWARLNLDNPNATAVKIARAELSAICRAVGVMSPRDSSELHNLPLMIKVRLRSRDDNGEMTNEIKGYAARSAAANTTPPTAMKAPPWKRA